MSRWVIAWSFYPLQDENFTLPCHSINIPREKICDVLVKPPYCFNISFEEELVKVNIPQSKIYCWKRSARRAKRALEDDEFCKSSSIAGIEFGFWMLEKDNFITMCYLPKKYLGSVEIFSSLCNHLQKAII